MTLHVVVTDLETGDVDEVKVPDGEYLLICAGSCELTHTQSYNGGRTHQLTIKGRVPR